MEEGCFGKGRKNRLKDQNRWEHEEDINKRTGGGGLGHRKVK